MVLASPLPYFHRVHYIYAPERAGKYFTRAKGPESLQRECVWTTAQFTARLGILLSGRGCTEPEGRRKLLPHERPLLTDQQLRDATIDQIEDLVHRLNLVL
jgi:hypothetical protein